MLNLEHRSLVHNQRILVLIVEDGPKVIAKFSPFEQYSEILDHCPKSFLRHHFAKNKQNDDSY